MMMFPIFTVYVTSLVQNANKRKNELYNEDDAPQPEAVKQTASKPAEEGKITS